MNITIGTNIKRLRKNKDITQEQLSEAMNVTCAAVSKWERGETYPDITQLQPLAYYFGVTLDKLMGYNQEKVQAEIEEVLAGYTAALNSDSIKARKIITKAYRDYPNDYRVMNYYMWNIAGDMADNDPSVILAHQQEFLAICDKILDSCTQEALRLNVWNMRAKILHAQGKTDQALQIYQDKFPSWYNTVGQKSEQLFAKNTQEFYYWTQKNMLELAGFAADKLGKVIYYDSTLSIEQKTEKALKYAEYLIDAVEKTSDIFFAIIAYSFLGRMKNDLKYRGGSDANIIRVMDKYLYSTQKLTNLMNENETLRKIFMLNRTWITKKNLLEWTVDYLLNNKQGRNSQLLQNPEYVKVLNKYK